MNEDIDELYRRDAALDVSRPSETTRAAILEHARAVASRAVAGGADAKGGARALRRRVRSRWWAGLGALAAAVFAGLLVTPLYDSQVGREHRSGSVAQSAADAAKKPALDLEHVPRAQEAEQAPSAQKALSLQKAQSARRAAPAGPGAPAAAPAPLPAVAVDSRDARGRTPLFVATLEARADLVDQLLARGADPNAKDAAGLTPLDIARTRNLTGIRDALLRAGAH